jgi:hypothetical protein
VEVQPQKSINRCDAGYTLCDGCLDCMCCPQTGVGRFVYWRGVDNRFETQSSWCSRIFLFGLRCGSDSLEPFEEVWNILITHVTIERTNTPSDNVNTHRGDGACHRAVDDKGRYAATWAAGGSHAPFRLPTRTLCETFNADIATLDTLLFELGQVGFAG